MVVAKHLLNHADGQYGENGEDVEDMLIHELAVIEIHLLLHCFEEWRNFHGERA